MTKAHRVPSDYCFLVYASHFWGKGRSEQDALRQVHLAGGKRTLRASGYLLYRVHPSTVIDDLGSFTHPRGHKPIKVGDRLK